MLEAVKNSLGITTAYQDETIQQYINEVQEFLIDGGVSETIVNSPECYGLISRGVADLWNYGSGGTRLSSYFIKRATQLVLKSKADNNNNNNTNTATNTVQEGV